jgi:hypothetical protein
MEDFSRTNNNIIIQNNIDFILQQIDILLDTNKYEVLGDNDFGSDYDRFLYELNVSNDFIKNYVYNNITSNIDMMDWELSVDVQILAGVKNDIILLELNVFKDDDVYSKVYRIDSSITEPKINI